MALWHFPHELLLLLIQQHRAFENKKTALFSVRFFSPCCVYTVCLSVRCSCFTFGRSRQTCRGYADLSVRQIAVKHGSKAFPHFLLSYQ